jgi:hypothetical protein
VSNFNSADVIPYTSYLIKYGHKLEALRNPDAVLNFDYKASLAMQKGIKSASHSEMMDFFYLIKPLFLYLANDKVTNHIVRELILNASVPLLDKIFAIIEPVLSKTICSFLGVRVIREFIVLKGNAKHINDKILA